MAVSTVFEYCMILQKALKDMDFIAEMPQNLDSCNDLNMPIHCNYKQSLRTYATYKDHNIFNECLLKKITFEIATFMIHPSTQSNIYHSLFDHLKTAIDDLLYNEKHEFESQIIRIIVDYTNDNVKWNKAHHRRSLIQYKSAVTDAFDYRYNEQLITYKKEVMDALNVPSTFEIDLNGYNDGGCYRFIVHCCVLYKADEMWIGLMNKRRYSAQYTYPMHAPETVVLFGGRARTSARITHQSSIWMDGECRTDNLPSWKAGDWISLVINIINTKCYLAFYQNGAKLWEAIDIEPLKGDAPLILYALVDANDDTLYVEQSMNHNQLSEVSVIHPDTDL
eukprot:586673_1